MEDFDLSKRIKGLRTNKGLTQDQLADISGLSLRTIQRIENGETVSRGDTLKRLAMALQVAPDEIIDFQMLEDKNVLIMLCLSQLGFLFFPLLGIVIPLVIWLLKKESVKYVDNIGKSVLNFQISWLVVFFICGIMVPFIPVDGFIGIMNVVCFFYIFNIYTIIKNTIRIYRGLTVQLKPAFRILQ